MKKPPSKARKSTKTKRKDTAPKPKAATKTKQLVTPVTDAPPAQDAPDAVVVKPSSPVVQNASLRKADLINDVCSRSGMKKKDVKPVVEATLEALGDALAKDQGLNLPPFAKLKIQKVKQLGNARVTIARLRQNAPKVTD